MSDAGNFDKGINLEEIHSAILNMDQERLVHMRSLGIVLRLMEAGSKASDKNELYSLIVKIVAEETGCENVSLLLYRPEREILELAAAIGISQLIKGEAGKFDRKFNKGLFFKKGRSIAWEVFDSQQPMFISDSSEIEIPLVENARQIPRSLACLPISSKGILNLSSSSRVEFTNGLKRNLIIIAQVIAHLIQGFGRGEVLTEGHFHIQNIVESNNRARRSISDDGMPLDYLMAAMENAPQGICLLDPEGKVLHANDSICSLLQSDEEFLQEKGLGRFFMDASVFLEFTKTVKGGEYRKLSQVRLIRPDGATFLADFFFHPVRAKNGEKKGGIVFIHDLSDHLHDSEKRVREEKLRALGSMAAGIAHDFNNLLMAILGNVELLQMELQGTKFGERLKNIETCVNDGAQTIQRIQAFVKGRSGGNGSQEKAIEISPVIHEAVQFTRPLWKDECEKKGIYISIEMDLEEGLMAKIPGYELRETLINLMINAIDAMPTGGKIIIRSYKKDEYAVIEVRDTGSGMDEDVLPHIFDPYFSTKETGSSGLGLSIVYGLISNVGGKVDVLSQKDLGTTFILSIPSGQETKKRQDDVPAESPSEDTRLKILVIDDEPQIVELVGLMLGSLGHHVTSCHDPQEAMSKVEKGGYDLVLTDLGMPGLSGWEVAERVQRISPKTRVVLMTGWGASFKEEDLKEKGVDALLTKPFRLNDILQVMSGLFKGRFQQP